MVVKEIEFKIKEAEVKALLDKNMGDDNAQVKEAKEALHRADLAVKEAKEAIKEAKLRADLVVEKIKYEIKEAKVEELMAQGKGEDDAQVKVANKALDDARDERNKASARLDEFTKTAAAPQGNPPFPSPF